MIQQIRFNTLVDLLCLFRTEMADGTVHKFQSSLDRSLADLLHFVTVAGALYMGIRSEFQINLISLVNGFLGLSVTDEGWEVPTDLTAQGELSVRKSTCAGKAGGDVAIWLTVDALLCFLLGTAALLDGLSLFH